ncbi:MAG: hypothetical protein P8Y81_07975 [Ignavibacteriaceae bacterium]
MKKIFLIISLIFLTTSCSVYETIVNLSRLQFKLGDVNNFELNGIDISGKSKLEDFNFQDLLKLTTAFSSGSLPVTFMLNVEAKNPNDGTGGYKRTDANIKSFPWRLLVNDKEAVSGDINERIIVPGTGEITEIPIEIKLDLIELFKNKGYEDLIDLALALGGKKGSSSKLTLYATPTVTTSLGDIKYPGELKIVDKEFTN